MGDHAVTPDGIPRPTRSRFALLHPRLYLGLHHVVGLLLAVASAWLFFALADGVPEAGAMVRVDNAVATWLQVHGTEIGESIFVGVSYLGAQVVIGLLIIVAITLIVRRDWRHLGVLVVTCGGGALLNGALKLVFHRARPSHIAGFSAGFLWLSVCVTGYKFAERRRVGTSGLDERG